MKKNNTKICLGFLHFLSSKRQCYPAEMAGQAMKIVQEEKVDIGVSASADECAIGIMPA